MSEFNSLSAYKAMEIIPNKLGRKEPKVTWEELEDILDEVQDSIDSDPYLREMIKSALKEILEKSEAPFWTHILLDVFLKFFLPSSYEATHTVKVVKKLQKLEEKVDMVA